MVPPSDREQSMDQHFFVFHETAIVGDRNVFKIVAQNLADVKA